MLCCSCDAVMTDRLLSNPSSSCPQPSATEAAALVWRSVAQWVGSLQAHLSGLKASVPLHLAGLRAALPVRLAGLRASLPPLLSAGAEAAGAAVDRAKDAADKAAQRAMRAMLAARKQLAQGKVRTAGGGWPGQCHPCMCCGTGARIPCARLVDWQPLGGGLAGVGNWNGMLLRVLGRGRP